MECDFPGSASWGMDNGKIEIKIVCSIRHTIFCVNILELIA